MSLEQLVEVSDGKTNKLTLDTILNELKAHSTEATLTLEQMVDQLGRLNNMSRTLSKRIDELKTALKETGMDRIDGDRFYVEFKQRNEIEISPTKMLKWLKEHDQINLIDALMKVGVTEVRKYLGDIICNSLGKTKNGNYRTLYVRQKNQVD